MTVASSDEHLELLSACLAHARGQDFFLVLAEHLGAVTGATETRISEAASAGRARTLAAWRARGVIPNYEYELAGTPCARIHQGESLLIELEAAAFPAAPADCRGYFGLPLTTKDGAVLGHLCAWFEHAPSMTPTQRAVCDILADRAAVELRLVHVKRERAMLRAQRRQLRAEIDAAHDVHAIVGVSAAHQRVMQEARRFAASHAAILISGEPGSGKELLARAIHAEGPRARKPFTKLDCAALSIDSELAALPQLLGVTGGGTLYIDAVDTLSTELQQRLQAALEAWDSARRDAPSSADVRLVASTRRDLLPAVRDGEFSQALFGRLHMFAIEIPPLRTRVEDIAPLLQLYTQKLARRSGRAIEGVDPDSLAALMRYSWPGNVRELVNLVERAVHTQHAPVLKIAADLIGGSPAERAALIAAAAGDTTSTTLSGTLDFDDTLNTGLHAVQREHILRVLNATRWVIEGNSGAALRLGLKPATLRHRMKKLGIARAQTPQ